MMSACLTEEGENPISNSFCELLESSSEYEGGVLVGVTAEALLMGMTLSSNNERILIGMVMGEGERGGEERKGEREERKREEVRLTFLLQVIICSAPPIGTNERLNNPKQYQ